LNYAINTGKTKVIDARGQSISRGVHNGVAFANFKSHKFSYLNVSSLGTDYVLDGDECGFACVCTPSCFSYNLAAFYDINGTMLCELLPSDKNNNSDKFVSSQSFHHFSVVVSTPMTASLKCIFIFFFFFFLNIYFKVLLYFCLKFFYIIVFRKCTCFY